MAKESFVSILDKIPKEYFFGFFESFNKYAEINLKFKEIFSKLCIQVIIK